MSVRVRIAPVVLAAAGMLAVPLLHSQTEDFYIHIYGTKQGDFTGASSRPARKGWSECISYYYAAQGSTLQHMRGKLLIVVRKELDAASQQFIRARKDKEVLPNVVLEFANTTEEGKEDVFQRIKLTNARVAGGVWFDKQWRPNATHKNARFEEVEFTWEKIESEHKPGSPFWNPEMTRSQPVCRVPKVLKDLCP